MSRIGSLLVAGRSSSGAWSEVSEAGGVAVQDVSGRGTAVVAAGGVPSVVSLTGRSLSASPQAQLPGGLAHAARTVLFARVAESRDFFVACTRLGRVYFAGCGASGSPEDGGSRSAAGAAAASVGAAPVQPVLVPSLESIVAVAAGEAHCLALRADGCAFAWGRNDVGQLGLGASSAAGRRVSGAGSDGGAAQFQGVPRFLSSLHRIHIAAIACGARHTLLVTDEGALFTCGEGLAGQLGVGRCSSAAQPQRVSFEVRGPTRELAAHVRAKGVRLAQDNASGDGSPLEGDTGTENDETKDGKGGEDTASAAAAAAVASAAAAAAADDSDVITDFNPADVDVRVSAAAGGFGHSVVLTHSGHVFTFGLNSYGQLGLGDTASRCTPQLVFEMARETVGLSLEGIGSDDDDSGDVEAYAQAGHVLRPLLAQQVACGVFHTAFLTIARGATGAVLTCGSSADGRLGQQHMAEPAGSSVAHVSVTQLSSELDGSVPLSIEDPASDGNVLRPASGDPSLPQHPDHRWLFPSGFGPLCAPHSPTGAPAGLPAALGEPAHYVRNKARDLQASPAGNPDKAKQKPSLDAVRAGTWTVPLSRTLAHREMLAVGRHYALALTAGVLKQGRGAVGVVDGFAADAASSAAISSVNPRLAPHVYGLPWLRAPRTQCPAPKVKLPTALRAAVLEGRVVTHISCSEAETILFTPAILKRAVPHACADFGGTLVTLSGPGLNSVAKVPEATLHASLATAASADAADEALRLYAPRRDATGMLAIAGVYVRWTCRFDSAVTGLGREVRPAARDVEVHFSRAYYAVGADLSGFRGLADKPYPFRARLDGSLFPASPDVLQHDLDLVRTVAPAVSRPCEASVEIVVLDASRGEADLLRLGADAVVHGSCRFFFYTNPSVRGAGPKTLSPSAFEEVVLVGDNFFGCALVDTTARPVAEALVAEVQADVLARETAETTKLTAELRALDSGAATGRPRPGTAAAAFAVTAALKPTAPPLLHMKRAAGSAVQPCEVLVTFDVLVDGVKVARSDPTHGFYTVAYDEHVVDVRAASMAIAAVQTGIRLPTGSTAPVTTPSGGLRPAAVAADLSDDGSKQDDDAEGIVGTYSASVSCELPDLGALVTASRLPPVPPGLAEAVDALYASVALGPAAPAPETGGSVEGGEAASVDAVASAAATAAAAATEAAAALAEHADALRAARSLHYEALLVSPGSGPGQRTPPLTTLVPRLSTNGGVDWLDSESNISIRCVRPEPSHVSPAALLLRGDAAATKAGVSFRIFGTGFVAGKAAAATLGRETRGGAILGSVACEATVVDETTIAVHAPLAAVRSLLPSPVADIVVGADSDAEADGLAGSTLELCGFFTVAVSLTIAGHAVPALARPLRLIVCLGSVLPGGEAAFISAAGGSLSFTLSRPNAPPEGDDACFDALSHLHVANDASGAASWTPPALTLGSLLTGLTMSGGSVKKGGDGSGSGGTNGGVALVLTDSASHVHTVTAALSPGGLVSGRYEPFGLALAAGPLRAAIVLDGVAAHALPMQSRFVAYNPHALTVTAVTSTAKKLCVGTELVAAVTGLQELLVAAAGVRPSPDDVVVRLTLAGAVEAAPAAAVETVAGQIAEDGTTVTFMCPDLVGTVTVEVSLARGYQNSFTVAPRAAPGAPSVSSFVAVKK